MFRRNAHRTITAVRLRGVLYRLFKRDLGTGHGLALFLSVLSVISIGDLLRLLDAPEFMIDDD